MSQTSDDSTDVTIFVKRFGTTPCEVGNLVATEFVNLLDDISKHSAVVQLLLLAARNAILLGLVTLHLGFVFSCVDTYAHTLHLLHLVELILSGCGARPNLHSGDLVLGRDARLLDLQLVGLGSGVEL